MVAVYNRGFVIRSLLPYNYTDFSDRLTYLTNAKVAKKGLQDNNSTIEEQEEIFKTLSYRLDELP